jgi:hypothetical protein
MPDRCHDAVAGRGMPHPCENGRASGPPLVTHGEAELLDLPGARPAQRRAACVNDG